MSDPRLEIALEHHRAGRFRQAETAYRAMLQEDAQHADAAHWLGVLLHQAGNRDEAIPLLQRAVDARPADAAFQHNLAQALLTAGRHDEAIDALKRAAHLSGDQPAALQALGDALLARHHDGDAAGASDLFRRAIAAGLDTAENHHRLGVALLSTGRADEAIGALQTAVQKKPDLAHAHFHLSTAHRARHDPKAARKALNKALEADPGMAAAWLTLAAIDAEAGNFDIAAGLIRRAIKLNPDDPSAHAALARVMEQAGRGADAVVAHANAERAKQRGKATAAAADAGSSVDALEERLTPSADAAQLHFALAAVANVPLPAQVPSEVVEDLFDRYADRFDNHLRGRLEYRVPELLAEAVGALPRDRPWDILDLGCGTGLCGMLLRPFAGSLTGVDLSPNMIEKSRERGVYDRLELADVVAFLHTAPAAYDLIVAADVLIYIGDLVPIFEAAAASVRHGGYFAFSVEAAQGDRYELRKRSRRFAHSAPYVRHVAALFAFEVVRFDTIVIRTEGGQPLPGYLIVLRSS